MTDFVNLPNLRTLKVVDQGSHYEIEVEGCVIPTACPACGCQALYKHGTKAQSFMDVQNHDKRTIIHISRKRYRCSVCGKTLMEPLPDMDSKRMATERMVGYIEKRCLSETFVHIANELGIDEKTVRHVFDDHVQRLRQTTHFETPEILGIDEIKITGSYRCMITNIAKLSIFDLLPNRSKADLLEYFKKMPDKQNIGVVTMDMWQTYRDVVRTHLPGRLIVSDRFHVVRMANEAMESIRKELRKSLSNSARIKLKDDRFVLLSRYTGLNDEKKETLERWSKMFPVLGIAYRTKETLHDIYNHPTKAEAQQAFLDWAKHMDPLVEPAFKRMIGSIHNWWDEVFAYYDCPVTNGYTESANNLAKEMNRVGRGYSFDVVRAKLIYDSNARDVTKVTIRGKGGKRKDAPKADFIAGKDLDVLQAETGDAVIEYGPHIPTLVKLLKDGHFS